MVNKILRRILKLEIRRVRSLSHNPKKPGSNDGQPVILNLRWDPESTKPAPHYLAICGIFKNEAAYLREWIEFHKLVGVEKFFLYNNNSTDDFLRVLAPYLREGTVVLTDWNQKPPFNQRDAYHHCLEHYGFYTRWLAFLDIDEFVHAVGEQETLTQALRDYEEYPALAIHWLMFGPGNHILKPEGLVTENFRLCNPSGSKTVKVIVDPRRVEYVVGPHSAVYKNDELAVDENFKPTRANTHPVPTVQRLRVNHYWTKSAEEFFLSKISRGYTDQTTYLRDISGLLIAARQYSLPNDTIQRFVPQLKRNCPSHSWPIACRPEPGSESNSGSLKSRLLNLINKALRRFANVYIQPVSKPSDSHPRQRIQPVVPHAEPPAQYLAICGIFKNEAAYLREWIEFHKLVGVEKFFLYNNNSTDDFLRVLAPYLREETVVLTDWEFKPPCQTEAYDHCIAHHGHEVRWLAFLDIDEFVHTVKEQETLTQALRDYEEYPALAIHWLMFGPGNHILKPEGLVTENFRNHQPQPNKVVKVIVNPQCVEYVTGPHSAVYKNDAMAVDENFKPVQDNFSLPASVNRFCINHYWTKSIEEVFEKWERGNADNVVRYRDPSGLFLAAHLYDGASDHSLERFHVPLKTALAAHEKEPATASDQAHAASLDHQEVI